MTWTVVWKPSAERHLAKQWLSGSDRQAIADASNRIDRLLKHFPDAIGDARDHGDGGLVNLNLAFSNQL